MRLVTVFASMLLASTTSFGVEFIEDFGGPAEAGYFQGAMEIGLKGDWHVSVQHGLATLENTTSNAALRFYDLPSIGSEGIQVDTDGAYVTASVRAVFRRANLTP